MYFVNYDGIYNNLVYLKWINAIFINYKKMYLYLLTFYKLT
jgi:hypothetical protein